ncbi:MAG: flippase activity-associated protein Agl23 [Cyanobacteriota bacterium]
MNLLTEKQLKRLYLILILFIITIGIAFRLHSIDLRVLFTDEAVHYNFIKSLNKTQQYKYKEIISFSYINTLNDTLNIYHYFENNMNKGDSVWKASSYRYKELLKAPIITANVNLFVQPYYYFRHLFNNKSYIYDPVYHGPFIYYLGDLVFNIAGQYSIWLLRLPMVLCSILGLCFVFLFFRHLGKFGLFLTLMLMAVSPALVYYSNLANYENYIAYLNILGVGLLLLGIHKRSPMILFASGFTLLALMTIKETALVAWFCIVVATSLTYIILYIKNRPSDIIRKLEDYVINTFNGTYNKSLVRYVLPALLCFIISGIFFAALYSSFGGNPVGVHDGLTSWMYWKNTGASGGHVKPFGYYNEIIIQYDFMIVFLFFTGAIVTIFTTRDRYKIFLAFWAILLWFVYSCIPYKTPWLVLNFLAPFAIVAGIGWNIIYNMMDKKAYKYITVLIILVLTLNAVTKSIEVKWITYDYPENKFTYVHTYREFEEEVKAVYSLAQASRDGYKINISVAAPEYWPLPAYIDKFPHVGYFTGIRGRNLNLNAPIVINDKRDNPELVEYMLESDVNDFVKLRDFKQRPGVDHTIFVKEDLLKTYLDGKHYDTWLSKKARYLLNEPTRY